MGSVQLKILVMMLINVMTTILLVHNMSTSDTLQIWDHLQIRDHLRMTLWLLQYILRCCGYQHQNTKLHLPFKIAHLQKQLPYCLEVRPVSYKCWVSFSSRGLVCYNIIKCIWYSSSYVISYHQNSLLASQIINST